jgi:hypothetical protein
LVRHSVQEAPLKSFGTTANEEEVNEILRRTQFLDKSFVFKPEELHRDEIHKSAEKFK